MKSSSRVIQYTFFVLFVLSVLVAFLMLNYQARTTLDAFVEHVETGDTLNLEKVARENAIDMTASIVSMLVTLLGFVVTTVINVRKDRREARESELALKQKEVELQRALIELEELKKKISK